MRTLIITTCHLERREIGSKENCNNTLELIKRIGVPVTLLLANQPKSLCTYDNKQKLLELEANGSEIGLHLHPNLLTCEKSARTKILVEEIKNQKKDFGITPKSFSGSHWCTNAEIVNELEKQGITADASVVPGTIQSTSESVVVNYRGAPYTPYFPSPKDIRRKVANRNIVEFPITTNPYTKTSMMLDIYSTPVLKKLLVYAKKKKQEIIHQSFHSYNLSSEYGRSFFLNKKIKSINSFIEDNFDSKFVTLSEAVSIFRNLKR